MFLFYLFFINFGHFDDFSKCRTLGYLVVNPISSLRNKNTNRIIKNSPCSGKMKPDQNVKKFRPMHNVRFLNMDFVIFAYYLNVHSRKNFFDRHHAP